MSQSKISKKIALLTNWFEPGYKAGGPIRSVANLVGMPFDSTIKFQIYCNQYDLDGKTYDTPKRKNISYNTITDVFYMDKSPYAIIHQMIHLVKLKPNVLYINSVFSFGFSILPLLLARLKMIHPERIIIAPRGILKKNAIQYKSLKKKIFLSVFSLLLKREKTVFHFTDNSEAEESKEVFPNISQWEILSNIPLKPSSNYKKIIKEKNQLKITSIGRIHPIKNHIQVINALQNLSPTSSIEYSIVGLIDDKNYWEKCQREIQDLPPQIKVNYIGSLPYQKIKPFAELNHFVVQLSFSENFGHSIYESFSYGRPVVVSDGTPWKQLQKKGIGWDLPLKNEQMVESCFQEILEMEDATFQKMCKSAHEFSIDKFYNHSLLEKYKNLFNI